MKHNHNGLDSHSHHNQEEPEHHVGHAAHEEQVEQGMHDDHTHHEHHNHGDGGAHAHHNHGNFKELFLKSLPLGVIVMLLSPMFGFKLPFQFTFPYSNIVVSALSTILIIYGRRPFFQGAVDEFKQKQPGMMALVSLGIGVSYLYSIYAVVATYVTGDHVMDFFFEFSSLLLIMLLGHWIEMKAVGEAGDAQGALAALVPKDAHVVLEDESIETRPVLELHVANGPAPLRNKCTKQEKERSSSNLLVYLT